MIGIFQEWQNDVRYSFCIRQNDANLKIEKQEKILDKFHRSINYYAFFLSASVH